MACKFLDKCPYELKDKICKAGNGYSLCTCFIKLSADEKASKEHNIYWNRVCDIADRQRKKGMQEYGKGIEDNHENITKRLEYLEEEFVDALMYLEWIKAYLSEES